MGRVDTVEWGGSGSARRRRLPVMRLTVPRTGAVGLAGAGFLALVAAEFLPWGRVHTSSSAVTAAVARSTRYAFSDGQGIGLDRVQSFDVVAYHLGMLLLFGAIGLGLAGAAVRRRAAMGAALGLAAGTGLAVLSVYQSTSHYFDSFGIYYFDGPGPGPDPSAVPTVSTGPGVFLAVAGTLLLAGAALACGFRSAGPGTGGTVRPAADRAHSAEEDRELTVGPLEPVDQSYFARPESR
jgi:hypothetical protein